MRERGRRPRGWALRAAMPVLLAGALLPALAGPSRALDLSTTGWARYRYFFVANAPVVPVEGKSARSEWLDQRISLYPTLRVNDWAFLQARLDLLDGVVFGKRGEDESFLVALADATDRTDRRGEEVQAIDLGRAYVEVKPPYGVLRVGRQGSHWGLGILANAGDSLEWGLRGNGPEQGDTVDRAAFLTDIARPLRWREDHLIIEAAYDRPVDPDLSTTGDEVNAFVLAALFTNGTLTPRSIGTREVGLYATYLAQDRTDLQAALLDGYGHLDIGPFYLEGEGVLLFGGARRSAFVPRGVFDEAEHTLVEGAVPALEAGGVPDAQALARQAVEGGSPQPALSELLVPAYEQALLDAGYTLGRAIEIASAVDALGLDSIRRDEVDLSGFGFLARGGMRTGSFHAGVEVAVASGQDGGDDVAPVLVGPFWHRQGLGFETADAEERARLASAGLTGERSRGLAFDPEFDPALILFEEVGPVNVVTGRPAVVDAWYWKGFGEIFLDPRTTVWGSVLYGQLLEKYRPFEVKAPADCSSCAVEIGVGRPETGLGAEVDAGIEREIVPNVRAELKLGYLVAGGAFGENARDVWMIRPQLALEF